MKGRLDIYEEEATESSTVHHLPGNKSSVGKSLKKKVPVIVRLTKDDSNMDESDSYKDRGLTNV